MPGAGHCGSFCWASAVTGSDRQSQIPWVPPIVPMGDDLCSAPGCGGSMVPMVALLMAAGAVPTVPGNPRAASSFSGTGSAGIKCEVVVKTEPEDEPCAGCPWGPAATVPSIPSTGE